jgi:hypothetical protein
VQPLELGTSIQEPSNAIVASGADVLIAAGGDGTMNARFSRRLPEAKQPVRNATYTSTFFDAIAAFASLRLEAFDLESEFGFERPGNEAADRVPLPTGRAHDGVQRRTFRPFE